MKTLIISKPHVLVFGILSLLIVFFGQRNLTFPLYSTTSGSSSRSIFTPKPPTSNFFLAGNLKKESNLANHKTSATVDITVPSLVDLCRNNEYVTLPPIVIAETASGDFKNTAGAGKTTATLRIRTPNNTYNNSTASDLGFEVLQAPVNISISGEEVTLLGSPQIQFNTGNNFFYLDFQIDITGETKLNTITIEGIKVRATRGNEVPLRAQSFNWQNGSGTTTSGVFTGIANNEVFATVSALAQTNEISLTGLTNVNICKNGKFTASDKFDVASGTGTARWFSDATLLNQVAEGDRVTVKNGTETNGINSVIGVNPTAAGVLTYYVVRDNNGCLSTAKTVTVTIQDTPTITLFSNSFNNKVCKDGSPSITFTATGASNYSFEIDKGSGFVAATDPTDGSIDPVAGTFTINTSLPAGSYSVQATSNAGGCTATSATRTFEINPLPSPVTLSAGSTTIVTGDSTPLTISPAGGTFSGLGVKQTGTMPDTYIFDSKDLQEGLSYDVIYSYTNGNGCTANAMVTIAVNAKQPLVQDLSNKALSLNVCVTQNAIDAKVNTSRAQLQPNITCTPGNTITTTYAVSSSPNTPGLVTLTNANTGRFIFNPRVLNNIPSLRTIEIRVVATHICSGDGPSQTSNPQTYPINFHPEFQLAITGFEPIYCETMSNNTNIDFVLKNRRNTINDKVQFYLNGDPVSDTDPRINNTTHTFNPYQLAVGKHKIRFEYTDVCTDSSPEITIKVIAPPALAFAAIEANTYCNEAGNKLQLAPTINGKSPTPLQAQNGFFTIKDGANETKLNNGVNEIDLSKLTPGKTYQVFYTYTAGTCVKKTVDKNLVMVNKPTLVIEGIVDGDSYCTNSADVTLTAKVTSPLGTQAQTTVALGTPDDYIEMKSVATGATRRLAAKQLQFSAFAPGVYEATFFHKETGSYQCSSSVTVSITINKPEVASFNGVNNNDQFCVAKGIISLTPLADNQSSLNRSNGSFRIWQKNSSFEKIISANTSEFNTNDLNGVGDYNITFSYKDGNNCEDTSDIVTFSLVPVPDSVQVTVIKEFNQNVVQYNSVANGGATWSWKFDDGTTASTQNHLRKLSSTDNTKEQEYTFEVRNNQNCVITHTKNFVLNFGFTQQCQGGATRFSDSSSSKSDAFTSWLWNFGDGSTSTIQHASHLYASAGSYVVSLTVTTADGFAAYTLKRRVDIFPGFTVTPATPYFQDFSSSTSGWLSHGTIDSTGTKIDRTSWKLQVPAGFGHIPNDKGIAWVTDNTGSPSATLEAKYNGNEQSYVESPCFDITTLNRPMVSFSYWSDIDKGSDGVVLLYTIDDGKTWARVGNIDQGLNWYNTRPILGKPGNDFTTSNGDAQGWSGNTQTSWQVARFGLDAVLAQMNGLKTKLVRFRIAFGSNSDNTPNVEFDGFAFDDFQISNRNRLVLSEYFINHGAANAATLDKRGHDFAATKSEAINIHYHTNFPSADKINEKSEKDVSARSFHYGIRTIPRIVIDGLARDTLLGTWAEARYSTQTLITAPFIINLGQPTASNGILDVSTTITAIQAIDRKVVMQIVVIDTLTNIGGTIYRNSVMKMLPDGAGTFHAQPWTVGSQQTLNYTWDYGALGLDPGRFKVVVFIEDYDTKEIYQAGVSQVQVNRQGTDSNEGNKVTGVVDDLQKDNVKVFPNPTSRHLHIALKGNKGLSKETSWEIISANGQIVKRGIWSRGYKQFKLNIIDLATGVYLIRVYNEQVTFQRRFEKQ